MTPFSNAMRTAKRAFDRAAGATALACEHGFYGDCPVLSLQKPSWRNPAPRRLPHAPGIFFSIWITPDDAKRNRVQYNIHALKLRELSAYRITSRNFAEDFRSAFAPFAAAWPNISVDFGPQTLMQGWIDLQAGRLEGDLTALLQRFATLAPVVDDLLARRGLS